MEPADLIRWQWEGYPRYHQARVNLLLHILTAPLFCLGLLALLWGTLTLAWVPARHPGRGRYGAGAGGSGHRP